MENRKALELEELGNVNGGGLIFGTVNRMMKIINKLNDDNQDQSKRG